MNTISSTHNNLAGFLSRTFIIVALLICSSVHNTYLHAEVIDGLKITPPDSVFSDGMILEPKIENNIFTHFGRVNLCLVEVSTDSTFSRLAFSQLFSSSVLSFCVTKVVVSGLSPGAKYFLRLRAAFNPAEPEDPIYYSTIASRTLSVTLPLRSLPSIPRLHYPKSIGSNSFSVSWQQALGQVKGYMLEFSTDSLLRQNVVRQSVNATEVTLSALRSNTRYFYRVQSLNDSGAGIFSPIYSERTIESGFPFSIDRVSGGELFRVEFNFEYRKNRKLTIPQADSIIAQTARLGIQLQGAWFQDTTGERADEFGQTRSLLRVRIQNPDSIKLSQIGFGIMDDPSVVIPFGAIIRADNRIARFCESSYSRDYRNILVTSVQESSIQTPLVLSSAPNPFTDETVLTYTLPSPAMVKASLIDVLGNTVAVPLQGTWQGIGVQNLRISAQNLVGGVYFLRLSMVSAQGEQTRTAVLHIVK